MVRQGKAGIQRIRAANLVPGDVVEIAGLSKFVKLVIFDQLTIIL